MYVITETEEYLKKVHRKTIRYYYQENHSFTLGYTWVDSLDRATFYHRPEYAEGMRLTVTKPEEMTVISKEAANHWTKLSNANNLLA